METSQQQSTSAITAAQAGDTLLVIHDFSARSPDELSLIRGELIELIERDDDFGDGWYLGKHLQDGRTGLFPEVYTKIAPPLVGLHGPRTSRTNSLARHTPLSTTETITPSIFSGHRASNLTTQTEQPENYDPNTPAPLRSVSAPQDIPTYSSISTAPQAQRSISMVMDNTRDHTDSPVITETLGVIDEHITEMNTPRSSLLAATRNKGNDSGSDYSSYVDHRLSYITGNETDEEDSLTYEQVLNWNPAQAAQYLQEIGVEQRHCDILQEQEISGEVLLGLERSEIFMPELELGPIGRRLATWHKIQRFQEEVKSKKDGPSPSVTGSGNTSLPSTAGSSFLRGAEPSQRSPVFKFSQQNSPLVPEEDRLAKLPTNDSTGRTTSSAFGHNRRHSSMDFANKSENQTPPISPGGPRLGHRQQPSFDKDWTMPPIVNAPLTTRGMRASTMLGFGTLGMAGPGLPLIADRRSLTASQIDLNKQQEASDLDRGYLSSGEAEGGKQSKIRNLLRKSNPNSANHSRQNSYNNANSDARSFLSTGTTKRHSRFGSAGSIFNTLNSQLETHPTLGHQITPTPASSRSDGRTSSMIENKATRTRTLSGPSTLSTYVDSLKSSTTPPTFSGDPSALPVSTGNESAPPIVTKLEYSESPTSTASKSNPASPLMKSESFGALGRITGSFRPAKRSSSEATTNIERSQISPPIIVPGTIQEPPLQSPARTGSTTPSAASKSIEIDTTPDTSIKDAAPLPATRAIAAIPKRKNKKDTSAYKSLIVITPGQAMVGCTHSGWMHKKSAKMTSTFKSRYFVLKDKRLSYFYSMDDKIEKGLIDINSHRVEQVEHDIITSLYATLAGTKSSPNSPANVPNADGTMPPSSYGNGGPFFFKLVPPRAGLSRAVQFTRPAVHFFAVDNYEDGREWFMALKKATIDRDESQPITSTYTQKTISLTKAQEQRQRPPALMNAEDKVAEKPDTTKTQEAAPQAEGDSGLAIGGLNLSYEHIPPASAEDAAVNGDALVPQEVNDTAVKRPQSEQPTSSNNDNNKPSSTLRLVRSLSQGLGRHKEEPEAEEVGQAS